MIDVRMLFVGLGLAFCGACSPSARGVERPVPEWTYPLRVTIGAGEFEAVDAELERRAALPADEYFALCLRAEVRVKLERYDEAAADLRRALEQERPDAPSAWRAWLRYELGFLTFHFVGTPQEALEHYGAALAIDPRHFKSLEHRGFVHAELGDFAAAAADWRQALECWPAQIEPSERVWVTEWLVVALHSLGRSEEAESVERDESARRAGADSGG
ncbi:MAG: tetratricopeptide repeat protein [Planctomycetes bacterium]|nr:tetratricopeptide repeat protein [Planctomycetota bacterium]